MKQGLSFLISVLSISVLLLSCLSCKEDDFCTLPTTSMVNINFYSLQGDQMTTKSIYKFSARGNQLDSFYYDSLSNASKISLPLSNAYDTSTFTLTFIEIVSDTIEIGSTGTNYSQRTSEGATIIKMIDVTSTFVQDNADSIVLDTVTYIDTVQFIYDRQLYFISYACGFSYNYHLLEMTFTNNRIDSISITNSFISTFDDENLQILF
jgi:hypothetical protein